MWALWFIPAVLEMLCLVGSGIMAVAGLILLGKSIYWQTWKESKTKMAFVLLAVIILFVLAALLDWVWETKWIFTWERFRFA